MIKVLIDLFITILFSIFSSFYQIENDVKDNTVENTVIDIKEDLENEPITKNFKNNDSDVKNISSINVSSNKNNLESNNVRNNNVIEEPNDIKKEENNQDFSEPTELITKEEKVKTAWKELGISEYDYYNKPMWSWARVDYSIKDYGTFDNTHQACIDDGNKLDDIISFACTNINSFSGDYLGDMLRIKK